jgi:hypothetical protein
VKRRATGINDDDDAVIVCPEQNMKLTASLLVPKLGIPGSFPPLTIRLNEVVLN